MKRLYAFLAALILTVVGMSPAMALTAGPESRFKSNVRIPQQLIIGGNLNNTGWFGPNLVFRPASSSVTTLDTTFQCTTPSAARTYTIPDAGGNDSLVFLAATQTLTNKTLTTPSVGTGGIILKGTSFNDTVKANATQAQASVLTIEDVGGATGRVYTMAAAQAAAGVLSRADMITETGITLKRNLLNGRYLDGSVLAASAAAGKLGIGTTATFGSPATLSLVTESANNNTKTDDVEYEFTLPPDYVAGSAISVVVTQAITIGGGTLSVKTLTVDAFKVAADGTVGSNLGPAAQNLTNSSSALTFAITPTGLVAGNKLLLQFQTVLTETASSAVTANITDIAIQTSVKM